MNHKGIDSNLAVVVINIIGSTAVGFSGGLLWTGQGRYIQLLCE